MDAQLFALVANQLIVAALAPSQRFRSDESDPNRGLINAEILATLGSGSAANLRDIASVSVASNSIAHTNGAPSVLPLHKRTEGRDNSALSRGCELIRSNHAILPQANL